MSKIDPNLHLLLRRPRGNFGLLTSLYTEEQLDDANFTTDPQVYQNRMISYKPKKGTKTMALCHLHRPYIREILVPPFLEDPTSFDAID